MLYKFEGKEILEYGILVGFLIDKLANYLETNGKLFKLSPDFVPFLMNTAIGALRGMLALKTISTALADHPLPLIDLDQMLKTGYNIGD